MLDNLGRILIWTGLGIAVLGFVFLLAARIPGLGHLPGDISIQRNRFSVYIPLGTMILVSVVLTLLLNLIMRLRK
jgi:hypothetical protein